MWWIGSYPQNLAWMHAGISEKPEFFLWTMDGRMHRCLHHDSSSADTV